MKQHKLKPLYRWTTSDDKIGNGTMTEEEILLVYKSLCYLLGPRSKNNPLFKEIIDEIENSLKTLSDPSIRKTFIKQTIKKIKRYYNARGV